jgi:hypothetical protein
VANLSNNENKIDVMSCVLIELILLKIKEPKDHVRIPQVFPRVQDTFLSSSTRSQSPPNNEIPSPVQIPGLTWNLGADHLKIDVQVAYDIQLGRS